MSRVHPLTKWFRAHTPEQRAQLVKLAKTSRPYLRHVTAGRRALSLELKLELEIAACKIDGKQDTLDVGGFVALAHYDKRLIAVTP